MSLREYKRKRDFAVTAEPGPAKKKATAKEKPAPKAGPMFVVQKHDASRLHYDFRLEMAGVLASWAVPKGFPQKRGERHLAVHVEDHPVDYAKFEGIIPQGQYGGGTVMVWDIGTYELLGGTPVQAVKEGKLHLMLHGEKLRGEWTLVRSHREGDEKNWFLIKTGEGEAKITKEQEEHSVLTGRTLGQIAGEKTAVWNSNRGLAADERHKAASTPSAKKHPPLKWIDPMKATLALKPPASGRWDYEIKWDGYRAIAVKNGGEVELISRNRKTMTDDFPEIRDAVAQLSVESAVLDGEICALDEQGRPRFQLLQARATGKERPPLRYFVFDVLNVEGEDIRHQPLHERRQHLQAVLAGAPDDVRYSAPLEGDTDALLEMVRELGMEGLIGKKADSKYVAGLRSKEWIKLKVVTEQEFVIGGFTPPEGTRPHFGALIVGYYRNGGLQCAGKVGTGFNHALLATLHKQMKAMQIDACPFANLPHKSANRWSHGITKAEMRRCTWVKPELVCQVKFTEWTEDESLRHPVFLGLRKDKVAAEVVREVPE
jgi:bifunctional non-homologous end joining protein LigD